MKEKLYSEDDIRKAINNDSLFGPPDSQSHIMTGISSKKIGELFADKLIEALKELNK